jgi:hypothetical protein
LRTEDLTALFFLAFLTVTDRTGGWRGGLPSDDGSANGSFDLVVGIPCEEMGFSPFVSTVDRYTCSTDGLFSGFEAPASATASANIRGSGIRNLQHG